MPHSHAHFTTINGSAASNFMRGSANDEVLNGFDGDDTLRGGGGTDKLNGGAGDDYLHALDGGGLVGLRGGTGNDTLEAAIRQGGQAHMFGGGGDDLIVMDLTKDPNPFVNGVRRAYDGHHVYGGDGRDIFDLTNHADARGIIVGRIDDFDAAQDEIRIDGRRLDFARLPDHVQIFEYNAQQWLRIGANAYYVIEGARYGGGEDHFFQTEDALNAMLAADKSAQVSFVDQRNHVPLDLYESSLADMRRHTLVGENNHANFRGSDADDYVYDQRTRGGEDPYDAVARRFFGEAGNDVINAGKGADTVYGGTGHDMLAGGMDCDLLLGNDGHDWIFGGSQRDRAFGGDGRDSIEGGSGDDTLFGGNGSDLIRGGAGADHLGGGAGRDRMSGQDGRDMLNGGEGHDTIYGGDDRDIVWGNVGDDVLYGQNGADAVYGGEGHDRLSGGGGDDLINGGAGRDVATGGLGRDTFVFREGALVNWDDTDGGTNQRLAGLDRIEDFALGSDRIHFRDYAAVQELSDLRGWHTDFGGARYVVVNVEATDARFLIRAEETGLTWGDLVAEQSFEFA